LRLGNNEATQVKSIFLISQSEASKVAAVRVFAAAFGDDLRLCQHAATPDCCRAMPCARSNEFERAGYRVQLHTGHGLTMPLSQSGETSFLVVLEEPTIGAFACYEDDLRLHGRSHAVELLQYWLANEAIRRIDFWRNWAASAQAGISVVRIDDIVAAPRETLRKMASAAEIEIDDRALEAAARVVSELPSPADVKSLETSAHFARPCFVEFMNLLAQEANYLGYVPWQEPKAPSGPITTIYRALRALRDKDYEEVVSLLTSFAGTNAFNKDVRAMLGRALLEIGREVDGRRAFEVVLRAEPDYLDAYTILAEHSYEIGLNVEARGYLREAAARPNGADHVVAFLAHMNVDPDFAQEFTSPQASPLPIDRQSVVTGFQWILGRLPESEDVIVDHSRLPDDNALRLALLRSQEFAEFFQRFEAGQVAADAEPGEPVSREDVLLALHWILGRSLRSRAEADELLDLKSRTELRLKLVGAEELKQFIPRAA
jgi:tetratricopeptide (TPR) repeat protein